MAAFCPQTEPESRTSLADRWVCALDRPVSKSVEVVDQLRAESCIYPRVGAAAEVSPGSRSETKSRPHRGM
eukprot:32555-Pyramimonas_sp.AAC.1